MISTILIPVLQQRFPAHGLRFGCSPSPCAVFPAIHPDFGDIQIYDDGEELTVLVGNLTHSHFSNYDESLSAEQKAEEIIDRVADFLESLFADQIVVWGAHERSGGWHARNGVSSAFAKGEQAFVWSGPL